MATFPKFSHPSKETGYTSPGGILIPLFTGKLLMMKYTLPSASIAPRLFWGSVWLVYNRPSAVFAIIHFNRTCTTTRFSSISIDDAFSPSYIDFIVYYLRGWNQSDWCLCKPFVPIHFQLDQNKRGVLHFNRLKISSYLHFFLWSRCYFFVFFSSIFGNY